LYVGKLANAYFFGSEIAGQTDFLYGFGTAWIQSSILSMRNCGGGITAWKGTATKFPNKYGVYIHESRVQKANASLSISGRCSLGRPWVSSNISFAFDVANRFGRTLSIDRYSQRLISTTPSRNPATQSGAAMTTGSMQRR
jgi:pectin methylesterase-like acyl-CoA thioesterase